MKSLAVSKNVLRRILQDRRTLFLIVLLPLLFVLLYGYSFSGTPHGLRILVVNQDNGLASVRTAEVGRITLEVNLAERFIEGLDRDLFLVERDDGPDGAMERLGKEGIWVVAVFPQNFSHAVLNEAVRAAGERTIEYQGRTVRLVPTETVEGPRATLGLDDSNPILRSAILEEFRTVLTEVLATQQRILSAEDILSVEPLYQGEVRTLDYTAPGIIGFAMTLITVMLTAISIVRERTGGTLTRLLIAPIHPWQVTAGYTMAFASVSLFQVGELFLVSAWLFDIRIVGNPAAIALTVVLFAVGLQGIATLISTLARNEFQAMQFLLFLLIPSLMVSGVFWPLEVMPPGVRSLALVSPLTYANNALRGVMIKGLEIPGIALELAVLSGFAVLMFTFSVISMRRQGYTA